MIITGADREWIEAEASVAGFDGAGMAPVPDSDSDAARESDRRFTEWVESGRCGDMAWLTRRDAEGRLIRGDLRRAVPWARTVLVCTQNYNTRAPRSIDEAAPGTGWIARYAWSGDGADIHDGVHEGAPAASDYHTVLLPKLQCVEERLRERFGPTVQMRSYVDTGPVVERDYAGLAGVGWIGKNTCVLNQTQGSWLLLGVLITSLELAPESWAMPAADRCGTCTRCLEACPTHALTAPRQMDASRCIAYLTIEHKGSIREELREGMGRQVFGCDICQDVCPWNSHAPISAQHPWPVREQLVNPDLQWLASLDGPDFNRWFKGSPLERTRRRRVMRNVAIAMGNSGEVRFLPQLRSWTQQEDTVLAEAAQWALERLTKQSSEHSAAASRLGTETGKI